MPNTPTFASSGTKADTIDVRLSYRIVELFSEGLYSSPNKAIEELVANSFDAGARRVVVLTPPSYHDQDATIAILDDGEGMDGEGLRQHWLIGVSQKRRLSTRPRNRQQIGKFGIGKLATYVLSSRLTHISKRGGKYYSTSMNYLAIDKRKEKDVEPKTPIKIDLLELTEKEARAAIKRWTDTANFKSTKMKLFGTKSAGSWTLAIMSSLKPMVHDIKDGTLRWVLRTALPLRPDFEIWLAGEKLTPSKQGKGLIKKMVLGKDLLDLPKPCPAGVASKKDPDAEAGKQFGLEVPELGRVTGYVEVYQDLLTGNKSDDLGRSHGFFVYVFGRLVNVADGHFGIPPNELRHGTFGRTRFVVHMDGLDAGLRSNREALRDGSLLGAAQNVLRAVFNAVRPLLETHDKDEEPGAKLARKLGSSPASLSRSPIVSLTRSALEGRESPQYLIVPKLSTETERASFVEALEERAKEPDTFVTGVSIDYQGDSRNGIAQFEVGTGMLRINAFHPFVAAFHEEFTTKSQAQPLELIAMAEVLAEAHLYVVGVTGVQVSEFLRARDGLLRHLANESGRRSALSVANSLSEARNSPGDLEDCLCHAFDSLGLAATKLAKNGQPDGVATAHLSADSNGVERRYAVSLEAKSTEKDGKTIPADKVGISKIARQRDKFKCGHAVVVGPAFPTKQGDEAAIVDEMASDRESTKAKGAEKTITLITIDDLASLVKLRPLRQLGLVKLRELFLTCSTPEESRAWIDALRKTHMKRPPYKKIVEAIHSLQCEFETSDVKYGALRVQLSHLNPPIKYENDEALAELCKSMAQLAAGAMYATSERVELDQSVTNVIAAIDAATKEDSVDPE